MKRAPLYVLAGTVAGFAGVLGFHSRPGGAAVLAGPPSHRSSATGSSGQRSRPAKGNGGSQGPTDPAGTAAHSVTGHMVQYGYGELAVKVTARGGRIVAVSVPTIRTAEQYSQQLAGQVIPMLRSEVLAAQSARIHGISGATYTSEAYAMSLQSALDKLHIK